MNIKINKLEIENVKRVKAVKVEPTPSGLTVIGGKNNQGKTSVLDAICWALGGEKYRPSTPQRDGSVIPPYLRVVLNNGLVVERKGKNSDLKVIDPTGKKGGQQLLNEFVEQLALDLPKFMQANGKEKANTLLQIIGVGNQLHELELKEQEIYNRRHAIGQIADQKKKFAAEMPYHPDAPKEPISASDLIKQQQEILARNGENQRKRDQIELLKIKRDQFEQKINDLTNKITSLREQIAALEEARKEAQISLNGLIESIEIGTKTIAELQDESTTELEANIANIEAINIKVRANLDKDKAEQDALEYSNQYNALTVELEKVRQAKIDLLKGADLPLPGLSVVDGELTYNGFKWDNMSGSDQLKVSVAIVRRLNPKCGFVLLDKLEQMDLDTLKEFGQWLEQEGLQAIATRVSTGPECEIIIEDGYIKGQETQEPVHPPVEPKWKAGEF
jgi:predicted ATP-dependent endonuclease of OLD family